MEYFGDIVLLFMLYCMLCFTPFADAQVKMIMGFFCTSIVSLNIITYMFITAYSTVQQAKTTYKTKKFWFKETR